MFKPIDSELVKDAMNIGSELKAQAAPQPASERERRLEEALRAILDKPDGCPLCDSGVPRRTSGEHWDECPFENARKLLEENAMAVVTGTARISLIECYLTEEDPPADHDFARYGAVCGRCYNALAEMEKNEREDYQSGKTDLRDLLAIVAPHLTPMDTLSGLVSQINNVIASMRPVEQAQ
jgi:plasmid stabilization system protein ParE